MKKAVLIILAFAMMLCFVSCGESGSAATAEICAASEPVIQFYEALYKGDGDTMYQVSTPPSLEAEYMKSGMYADKDTLKETMSKQYAANLDNAKKKYGDDVKIKDMVIESVIGYDADQVAKIKKYITEKGFPEDMFQDFCIIKGTLTASGSLGEQSGKFENTAVKYDGHWYIYFNEPKGQELVDSITK